MQNNWFEIWNNRPVSSDFNSPLERLLKVDGYDNIFSAVDELNWTNDVLAQGEKLKISPTDSLLEVGCGAGAFLYPFYQRGNIVAGIDYSTTLVELATTVMPAASIECGEAINLPLNKRYDVLVSMGVFLYFPDLIYAANVLQKMVQVAKKSIGIFDIPDLSKQEAAMSTRKSLLGEREYQTRYEGLEHLYYDKNWFREVLAAESVEIIIEDRELSNYTNAAHRFNIYIYKNL